MATATNPFRSEELENTLSSAINTVRQVPGQVADAAGRVYEDAQTRLSSIAGSTGPTRNRPEAPGFVERFRNSSINQPLLTGDQIGGFLRGISAPNAPNRLASFFEGGGFSNNSPRPQQNGVTPTASQPAQGDGGEGGFISRARDFLFEPQEQPAAARSATGTPLTNYITGESGRTSFIDPATGQSATQRGTLSFVPMAEANAEFARANAIRQQTIDALPRPRERVVYLGGQGGPREQAIGLQEQARDLYEQALQSNDVSTRAALIGQSRLAQQQAGQLFGADDTDVAYNRALDTAGLNAAARADFLASEAESNRALARSRANPQTLSASEFGDLLNLGVFDELDEDSLTGILQGVLGFAEGGLVPSAMGTLGSASVGAPPLASLQEYQRYADGARSMGLNAVPFNDFLTMRNGASAVAGASDTVKMADGGMVPDASGKLVMDTDPNAPTDSIPAVIDGQQPAALDSGEFVFPKDVVMHFGTDKLNKMIQQAREQNGGQPSAIQSATA